MTTSFTPSTLPTRQGGDVGLTLVELVVTVVLVALVSSVIAASVIVIFRSEDGVIASTSESHDTQQVVSYLPLDIESGPRRASAYQATIGGAPGDDGTGCDETGNENVLMIKVTDRRLGAVDKRIAYRVVATANQARLDRYECRLDTSVTPFVWVTDNIVNVADYLDPSVTPIVRSEIILVNPAETDPDRQIVSRVILTYVQRGDTESIVAAPREEAQLSSDGVCTQEPLAAARNMAAFFERDVTLNNADVKGAMYVGGTLTFHGSAVAQAVPPAPTPPVPNDTGLLAGSINWAGSTGVLDVRPHRRVIIEDNNYAVTSSTQIRATSTAPSTPRIDKGSAAVVQAGSGTPIVTANVAFAKLRACADRLAGLPGSCDNGNCATHVAVTGTNYSNVRFTLTDGLANVLNIDEAILAQLSPETIQFTTGRTPTAVRPLIINVKSALGGTVTFEPPDLQGGGGSADYVLWNFPNASRVVIVASTDRMYGTIMAPYADVVSNADIEGGVIASTVVINNSTLHDVRYFQGQLAW